MSSAFAAAIDLLFTDPNLSCEAIWQPAVGDPRPIRIIARRADAITDFGETRLWSETARFDLRVAEVPTPRPGDRIETGGETFLIQDEPVRDRERLVWTVAGQPQ